MYTFHKTSIPKNLTTFLSEPFPFHQIWNQGGHQRTWLNLQFIWLSLSASSQVKSCQNLESAERELQVDKESHPSSPPTWSQHWLHIFLYFRKKLNIFSFQCRAGKAQVRYAESFPMFTGDLYRWELALLQTAKMTFFCARCYYYYFFRQP